MSFLELFEIEKNKPTPREAFINDIVSLTHRAYSTVTKWVVGLSRPDYPVQKLLSDHYGIPVEVLFPPIEVKDNEKQ